MGYSVLDVAPDHLPVSLDDAKNHLNIKDFTDDDDYILSLISTASSYVENYTQRAIITQTRSYYISCFKNRIVLPMPKLSSVTQITYLDTEGNTQVLSSTIYQVNTFAEPGEVLLAYGKSWPTTRSQENAVRIQYVCGYGTDASVPQPIKHAILILISHFYENREPVIVGTNVAPVPVSVDAILGHYVEHRF